MPQKFLVIQTAFIGDVVLATGIIEKLHRFFPEAEIDFLVRKGNESLLANHPFLNVLVWNKKEKKFLNLWKLLKKIRKRKYDKVINVQRFAATGLLTSLSGAKEKIGFDKNPFSFLFDKKVKHVFDKKGSDKHEIDRNNDLIEHFTDSVSEKPRLYPSSADFEFIKEFTKTPYITISPASVWFTKQFPLDKWVSFINEVQPHVNIFLLGAENDNQLGDGIRMATKHPSVFNLSGQLTFLQSTALIKNAAMNYVNDSASLHFASATNAPVTAIYCSTLPEFGFGPLSEKSFIVEIEEELPCRPCTLHGRNACPLGHFNCAYKIKNEQLISTLPAMT